MAQDENSDSRTLSKLILLEQACCDPRLEASHMRALAVILDACFDKPRCYIGPTSIGEIAGIDEKTARLAIKGLVQHGYLDTERRSQRSNWLIPNFRSAERSGRLVTYTPTGKKVHRPFRVPSWCEETAGTGTRYGSAKGKKLAGLQRPASGSAGPQQRVPTPAEAVIETITEAVTPLDDASKQQREQERRQEKEANNRLLFRKEYDNALVIPGRVHARRMENNPMIRPFIEDLIAKEQERQAAANPTEQAA